uniref:DUF4371 domain-containing protein n=1 Tax=Sinocyclocheilus rhinocerous TaxID=307959 RepID=A0A673H2J5_9TELE
VIKKYMHYRSTNLLMCLILLSCWRSSDTTFDGKLHEDMLFCSALEGTCTGSDIFTKLDTKIKEMGLSWDNCGGVCTDGAGALVGKNKGLEAKVLEVAPHVKFTHCIIHRDSLASKTLDSELNSVLKRATKIVNHIKSCPVNSRLLAKPCNEMGSQHEALLFHTEVRGKILGLEQGNVEMFPELEEHLEESGLTLSSLKEHIAGPLRTILEQFKKYFPKEMQPELYDWIRQPFSESRSRLPSNLVDASLELSSDRTLKTLFSNSTLPDFWIAVADEYTELSSAAMDVLLPFGSIYLCEQLDKYRSCLDVEDDLRVAVSTIRPRMKLLCCQKHVLPSH